MATVGTFRAAATCINPESLLTNNRHRLMRAKASSSPVMPQKLTAPGAVAEIKVLRAFSLFSPYDHHLGSPISNRCGLQWRQIVNSHRFAGP